MTSINKSEQKLFAVFGNPIIHSLSPNIFYYLFEQYKINADYLRITTETKEDILKTASFLKLDGFNITSPFKQSLLELLDSMDKPSQSIGAVNTVMVKNGQFHGYNTDYLGVINTLKLHRIKVENARGAILGAGGAARAAAYGLLQSKASHVTLLNRTEERARTAAQKLGCSHAPLSKAKEILNSSQIVISCLPSIPGDIKLDDLGDRCTVMDANYRNPSLFKDSTGKGCFYIDGREW
ncbi:MAG: shikimate dehydrogenase family protein, partial [Candidatus Aminicenantaceae bacterium]